MEAASWKDGRLALRDGQSLDLKPGQLTWTNRDLVRVRKNQVNVPVYLNGDRSFVLFSVDLESDGLSQDEVAQMGVCLTAA